MDRKIQGVGLAALATSVVIGCLKYYAPGLLEAMPPGFEELLQGAIIAYTGWQVRSSPNDPSRNTL